MDDQALLLQVSADVSLLEKQMARAVGIIHSSSTAMEGRATALSVNVGKSLDKVFDSSRLAVLDAGASRLRVFGSALEPLGPLGIAAGAGIAAVAFAAEGAKKAMSFGDEIEKSAKQAGVSTNTLQEYRFALQQSGGEAKNADAALKDFAATLGAAEHNLSPKLLKAFKSIGFDQSDLKSFKDVNDAIAAVSDKIAGMSTEVEKVAFAKKFGLLEALPLLEQGGAKIAALRQEAHSLGVVMDQDVVAHLAESNREFERLSQIIDIQLKSSFESAAPAIITLTRLIADSARALNDFVNSFRAVQDRQTQAISDRRGALLTQMVNLQMGEHNVAGHGLDGQARADYATERREYDTLGNELGRRNALDAAAPRPTAPTTTITDPTGPAHHTRVPRAKKGPADNFEELQKQALDVEDNSAKNLASAMAALAIEIQARADFEKQAVADELKKQNADLDEQEKKITADKGITAAKKKTLIGELETARTTDKQTAAAKTELIDRAAAEALRKEALELQLASITSVRDTLAAQDAIAVGTAKRRDIQLKMFALDEQVAELKLEEIIASKDATAAQKKIAQLQLDTLRATESDRRQGVANATNSPGQAYIKQLQDQFGAGQADTFQNIAVDGLKSLNSGLTDAIVNAGSLGAAFGNMAKTVEADLVNLAIEKYLTLPLAQALGLAGGGGGGFLGSLFSAGASAAGGGYNPFAGGFASGTDSAPGGLSLVGENGPELMNLPKGAQIIPNNVLAGLGSITPGMGASTTVMSFDLRGAVMTADLLDQMNSLAKGAEQRATMNGAALGVSTARQLIPAEMTRRASLRLR